MGLRRDERAVIGGDDLEVARDASEVLIAALQESDTAVETMHDSTAAAPAGGRNRRIWAVGFAGLLLALLGLMVARRRS